MPTLINNGDSESRKESTASNAGNGGGGNGKQHARKASKVCILVLRSLCVFKGRFCTL